MKTALCHSSGAVQKQHRLGCTVASWVPHRIVYYYFFCIKHNSWSTLRYDDTLFNKAVYSARRSRQRWLMVTICFLIHTFLRKLKWCVRTPLPFNKSWMGLSTTVTYEPKAYMTWKWYSQNGAFQYSMSRLFLPFSVRFLQKTNLFIEILSILRKRRWTRAMWITEMQPVSHIFFECKHIMSTCDRLQSPFCISKKTLKDGF